MRTTPDRVTSDTETLSSYCGHAAPLLTETSYPRDMREDSNRTGRAGRLAGLTTLARCIRIALAGSPSPVRAFLCTAVARYWRVALVMSGLLVQVVLVFLMWELVDLTISLMEVWAELARKHLELVLS